MYHIPPSRYQCHNETMIPRLLSSPIPISGRTRLELEIVDRRCLNLNAESFKNSPKPSDRTKSYVNGYIGSTTHGGADKARLICSMLKVRPVAYLCPPRPDQVRSTDPRFFSFNSFAQIVSLWLPSASSSWASWRWPHSSGYLKGSTVDDEDQKWILTILPLESHSSVFLFPS